MESTIYNFLRGVSSIEIPYVIWKNNHEMNLALRGESDLDVYVPLEFQKTFLDYAVLNSWIKTFNPIANFSNVLHLYLIVNHRKVLHLHVYFKIITGESWIKEFDLPLGRYLIKNRYIHDKYGVYVLNNKSQAYIFALRHIIKCGSISSRILYLKEIESYKKEWEFCNFKVDLLKGHGPILIDKAILHSGLMNQFNLSRFINSLKFRGKLSNFLRVKGFLLPIYRLISFIRRFINKLYFKKKKILYGKGLVIAISGVDGSGKSSMVDLLDSCLSSFLTSKRLSLGKPQGKVIEFFRKLLFNKSSIRLSSKENFSQSTGVFRSLLQIFLAILRLYESWKSQYYINKGFVVLVDRWPTNELGKMDGPKISESNNSNLIIKLLSRIEKKIYNSIPAADICFFMEIPIDEAIKRNEMRIKDGKETESEIRDRYIKNKMIRPIVKKYISFNNDGPLGEKGDELLALVSNELSKKNL